jgi:hypothetical protein
VYVRFEVFTAITMNGFGSCNAVWFGKKVTDTTDEFCMLLFLAYFFTLKKEAAFSSKSR